MDVQIIRGIIHENHPQTAGQVLANVLESDMIIDIIQAATTALAILTDSKWLLWLGEYFTFFGRIKEEGKSGPDNTEISHHLASYKESIRQLVDEICLEKFQQGKDAKISLEELLIFGHHISIMQIQKGGETQTITSAHLKGFIDRVDPEYKNTKLNDLLYGKLSEKNESVYGAMNKANKPRQQVGP